MAIIPLIFFGTIFLFIVFRRGFDASAYISLLYVITSLASVLMSTLNLVEYNTTPSFSVTLLYCFLLGLMIIPVYHLDTGSIQIISAKHTRALDFLVYLFFASFVFTLFIYWDEIIFNISFSDWDVLRQQVMRGEGYGELHFSGILRYLAVFFSAIGSASFLMMPIFFISLIFLKKPLWYCIIAFLSTANVILEGIINIDRSSTFKWLLFLGLCLVIFWPRLARKVKRVIIPVLGSVVALALAYFISVSVSRFEDSQVGTQNSIVVYAGQPYYNFCYLYERFDNHEGISTKYLFPATHYWVLKDYSGNLSRQQELTRKSGLECSLFYTVLGSFLLDANQIGPPLYVILYLILFYICLKKRNKTHPSLWAFLLNYIMLLIPTFGIIAYVYTSAYTNLFLVALVLAHTLLSLITNTK